MTRTTTRRHLRSAALLAAAAALLAGCAGGGSDSAGGEGAIPGAEPAPGVVEERAADAPAGEAAGDATGDTAGAAVPGSDVVLSDRSIIYTADLVVAVDDVSGAADEAQALVTRLGGFVQSESTYGVPAPLPVEPDGDVATIPPPVSQGQAVLVLRVPVARYDEAVDALEELGEVESRNRSAQDVTEEVVDVQSRIETQEASIDRLQALLAEATDIADILAIETELTRRLAELESLQARLEQLSGLSELATVTVTFVPPETVVEEGTGFLAGLQAGWRAFVRAAELGVTALGALLPFAVFFALLLTPLLVWLLLRSRRQRRARDRAVAPAEGRAAASAEAPAASPEPAQPSAAPPRGDG